MLPWGVGAAGSARHWQCRGQGFESPTLHHKKTSLKEVFFIVKMGLLRSAPVQTKQTPKTINRQNAIIMRVLEVRT